MKRYALIVFQRVVNHFLMERYHRGSHSEMGIRPLLRQLFIEHYPFVVFDILKELHFLSQLQMKRSPLVVFNTLKGVLFAFTMDSIWIY